LGAGKRTGFCPRRRGRRDETPPPSDVGRLKELTPGDGPGGDLIKSTRFARFRFSRGKTGLFGQKFSSEKGPKTAVFLRIMIVLQGIEKGLPQGYAGAPA